MMFRCARAINDGLHDFAASFVASRRVGVADFGILRAAADTGATIGVIHRDGRYQVELCAVPPGRIPAHSHKRVDTIEVGLAGAVRLDVNGIDPFGFVPDDRLGRFTHGRGIRINAGDAHGGTVLPGGAWFLSVQHWFDGEPTSVLEDYLCP